METTTSTASTTIKTFLRMASRALQEELDNNSTNVFDYTDDTADDAINATTSTTTTTATHFDPAVFWGVNGFLCFMLIMACTFCCVCKDWNVWLVNMHERRRQTDDQYQLQLRQQQQEQHDKKLDTPAVRKQKLLQSFRRHQVSMVRTEF
jgi:hypothetical protein